ncbi:MAG: dTMP kinase [Candidatus Nealsonbacteria bacterium RIFCSPLOWO2_01_FULL_43_32]|uniref:Thymidylate kinase n=1 Tax=Candidatus Nealsonbacteria bacterium RIFCSPLOWO2_01_FULL_43_32 TaxID=1801672 RepID=A0A1G2EG34_9BACT|nr:MAG: dTMP kinase [Candidatus Nealsonbacteria bacterium RIFCSPLOWO2_01_FULL_43_32]
MIKNPYLGKFIAFEGLDGSGQSTQANLLKDFLVSEGFKVILTKEPTKDSQAGKEIRQVLDKNTLVEPVYLQELFIQDRKEHLENLIIPVLQQNNIVISDRYFFSTFAYGVSDGLDLAWLMELNSAFLVPDLTFILKVRPEICLERIKKRGSAQTLFEETQKLEKVWQTYAILPNHIKNVYIIGGERPINEIAEEMKSHVHLKLNL